MKLLNNIIQSTGLIILERMASICAIIGLDFEKKTNLAFIVQKIRSSSTYVPLVDINDYLRFEVLQKDYDEGGNQI